MVNYVKECTKHFNIYRRGLQKMRIVNTKELKKNAEKLLSNVINNDEFFEIETKDGIAVVINEREWKILIDSLGEK